jgi:hypothetical protein
MVVYEFGMSMRKKGGFMIYFTTDNYFCGVDVNDFYTVSINKIRRRVLAKGGEIK